MVMFSKVVEREGFCNVSLSSQLLIPGLNPYIIGLMDG
jgi:hypothetical protein